MHAIFTCAPTETSYQEILIYYVPNLNRVKRSTNGFYHEINSSACQEAMCLLRNMRKQFRVLTKRSKQQFGGYLHITSILCRKLQSSICLQYYWMSNAAYSIIGWAMHAVFFHFGCDVACLFYNGGEHFHHIL